jgi:hypothetical protein
LDYGLWVMDREDYIHVHIHSRTTHYITYECTVQVHVHM